MSKLIGTNPNQVPSNADLGTAAFMEARDFLTARGSSLSSIDAVIAKNAVDIAIYDTSQDSDGGAWRKRTQHTSWYNERLNTDSRGSRREFPSVALLVVLDGALGGLYIYDADDPSLPMWMHFRNDGASWNDTLFPLASGNDFLSCVDALNGFISVGTKQNSLGLMVFSFIEDMSRSYLSVNYGGINDVPLSQRNSVGNNFAVGDAHNILPDLLNNRVHDVAMTVRAGAPIDPKTQLPAITYAVATESGVTIINATAGHDSGHVDIVNTQDSSAFNYVGKIFWRSDDSLVWVADSSGNHANDAERFAQVLHDYNTFASINQSVVEGDPNINEQYGPSNKNGNLRFLGTSGIRRASDAKDAIAFGTNDGLNLIKYNKPDGERGSIAFITPDYNTGWLHGKDIAHASLNDTSDLDLRTSTNLMANATYTGTTDRTTSASYTNGNGYVVIDDDENTADGYINVRLNGLQSGVDYIVTFSGNNAYTPTTGYWHHVGGLSAGTVYADSTLVGTLKKQSIHFTPGPSDTPQLVLYSGFSGGNLTYTIDVREAEGERTKTLSDFTKKWISSQGYIEKNPVAPGAELVGYTGFSTSSYLEQPYDPRLNFTTEMCIMLWVKDWGNGHDLLHRGPGTTRSSATSFALYCDGGYDYRFTMSNNGTVEYNAEIQLSDVLTGWQHLCFTFDGTTTRGYLNGIERVDATNFSGQTIYSQASAGHSLYIGIGPVSYAFDGSISLLKIGPKAPNAKQIREIYEDEKHLFKPGAKATLYGTSKSVTGLGYDKSTEHLHAGTASGRSVFKGLQRVDHATDPIGRKISAVNGMVSEE